MDPNNNNIGLPPDMGNVAQQPATPTPESGLGQSASPELPQPVASPVASNWTPPADPPQPVASPVAGSWTPPADPPTNTTEQSLNPVAVVEVLSPRGVEYVYLIISLFTAAFALIGAVISLIQGQTSFNVLSFPTAALIVSVPTFALLFLRLKKAEMNGLDAKLDPSKRRSTQFTQIVCFVICFFVLIGGISAIFAKMSGSLGGSIAKLIIDGVVIEVVMGGILFYYWRDEHSRHRR